MCINLYAALYAGMRRAAPHAATGMYHNNS